MLIDGGGRVWQLEKWILGKILNFKEDLLGMEDDPGKLKMLATFKGLKEKEKGVMTRYHL